MNARALRCPGCDAEYPPGPRWFGCDACKDGSGKPHWLEVAYDLEAVDRDAVARFGRVLDYATLLPLREPARAPNLGAGATPLLRLDALNREVGAPNLWLKVESQNPTGSFKDRLHTVSIGTAVEMGFTRAIIVTTGNSGVAAAAHAAAAGLRLLVVTHPASSAEQRRLMRLFGARIAVDPEPAPGEDALVREHGFAPITVAGHQWGVGNPFGVEGYKTIAFEVAAQLGRAPDRVCVPTAGGDSIYGPYKGFTELRALGLVDRVPAMTSCQAEGAGFVSATLRSGSDAMATVEPDTIALSIGDPTGSTSILHAIKGSGGDAWEASDADLLDTMALLGRYGLSVEAASAAPVAAIRRKAAAGELDTAETIVAVLTGSSMKWVGQIDAAIGSEPEYPRLDVSAVVRDFEEAR